MELGVEVFHTPIAFDTVAGPTQQLEVVHVVRSGLCFGYDMIDFQMLAFEVLAASCAVAALVAIQCLLVCPRVAEIAEIRSLRQIRSVDDITPKALSLRYSVDNEVRRLRRYVDTNPISPEVVCLDARRCAAAKRVQDHVLMIAHMRPMRDRPNQAS